MQYSGYENQQLEGSGQSSYVDSQVELKRAAKKGHGFYVVLNPCIR